MPKQTTRLPVQKTYKLFIGGKFARGESGRIIAARDAEGKLLANYCRASRKDFRDAVRAGRNAVAGWTKCSAYLRGQILYRAAEMLETRRRELESELSRVDSSRARARREVTATIDRLVYYAGWTDKFSQILGSVNPVATSHFNFTIPEATGVVDTGRTGLARIGVDHCAHHCQRQLRRRPCFGYKRTRSSHLFGNHRHE
jgi:acyl-CoA reductase-like NAD-dependent aldehyde dehydrogenase